MIEKKRPGFNAHKVKAKKNRRRQRRIRQINRAVDFNQFLKRAHRRKPLHAALNITTYGVPKMMQCRDITLRYAPVRETEGEINPGNPPALAGEYIAQAPCRVSKARNPAIGKCASPFKIPTAHAAPNRLSIRLNQRSSIRTCSRFFLRAREPVSGGSRNPHI